MKLTSIIRHLITLGLLGGVWLGSRLALVICLFQIFVALELIDAAARRDAK